MKTETIEGNKLIADFMDVKIGIDKFSWRIGCIEPLRESHLNYHKEWGWLMPVIEKIENGLKWKYSVDVGNNLYAINENKYCCVLHDAGNATCLEVESASKIEAVWLAVVEFINWYNKNK